MTLGPGLPCPGCQAFPLDKTGFHTVKCRKCGRQFDVLAITKLQTLAIENDCSGFAVDQAITLVAYRDYVRETGIGRTDDGEVHTGDRSPRSS